MPEPRSCGQRAYCIASNAGDSVADDAIVRRRLGLGNAGRKLINELARRYAWWEFLQCFLAIGSSIALE
ncbi:MAG: hypothetical protein D6723_03050 [Acidobacteria bacterium]|nr:MAG: hypothetical protein D6723_03050 [Acidobacteriota bacterium]